jgi:hypothetical protein
VRATAETVEVRVGEGRLNQIKIHFEQCRESNLVRFWDPICSESLSGGNALWAVSKWSRKFGMLLSLLETEFFWEAGAAPQKR